MGTLISTMLRTRRGFLLAWLLPLSGLVLMGGAAFPAAYPKHEDLVALSEQMANNGGLRALYGLPAQQVSFGSLIAWEIGMFVLILGSVMAILLSVGLSRAWEEDGVTEIIRSAGIARRSPTVAATIVSVAASVLLGVLVTVILVASRVFTDDIAITGSIALGAVTAVATATAAGVGLFTAQLFESARAARLAALGWLGAMFGIRAVADIWEIDWLRWLSNLGWRDVVRPFDANNFWPLLVMVAIAAALFAVSFWAASRRDLGGVWLATPPSTSKKVTDVRGMTRFGLRARLERPNIIGWGIATVALGLLFASMTGEMTKLLKSSPQTEELVRQMGLANELEQIYLTLVGSVVVVLVCCMVVQLITVVGTDERKGFLTPVWTSGVRHPATMFDAAATTLLATVVTIALTAGLMAAVVSQTGQEAGSAKFAALTMLGQIPAEIAVLGIAMLVTSLAPRLAWLSWIPLGVSGLFTLYGQLLKLPEWLLKVSVFAHPMYNADGWHWVGPVVLVAIGAAGAAAVPLVLARRDMEG